MEIAYARKNFVVVCPLCEATVDDAVQSKSTALLNPRSTDDPAMDKVLAFLQLASVDCKKERWCRVAGANKVQNARRRDARRQDTTVAT